jgi:hypothetical protein
MKAHKMKFLSFPILLMTWLKISFNLRHSEAGTIDVFDVTGRTVYTAF